MISTEEMLQKKNPGSDYAIVFFDGYCNMCNTSIDFLIRKDSKKILFFASQQSEWAIDFFQSNNFDANKADSIIFYHQSKFYLRSLAFLKIMALLPYPYKLMIVFRAVPSFLRDWVYNIIASNRYKWFGKRNTCRMPSEAEKKQFLS